MSQSQPNFQKVSDPKVLYQKLGNSGTRQLDKLVSIDNNFKKANGQFGDKKKVLEAINRNDIPKAREISNFYFRLSGIYNRLIRYMAYMYKYDWVVNPIIVDKLKVKESTKKQYVNKFYEVLMFLEQMNIKKMLGEFALKVFKDGCYYGYLIRDKNTTRVQDLPIAYCRSRYFTTDGRPVVEFQMKYFDDFYRSAEEKEKAFSVFPKDFKKGYKMYQSGKLPPCFSGDSNGWYILDPNAAFKFNLNREDIPPLVSVIPAIIDLDECQELDRKKMEQQLIKLIVQQIPLDKNGDTIVDPDEVIIFHDNAVKMLKNVIGADVLTSIANISVEDMQSNSATNSTDKGMDRVKSNVFDEAGVSQKQFNTDGNMALEKSILNDEASIFNLIQQFEIFLNFLIKTFNPNNLKGINFRVQILNTTIYNYKDLSKLYKEQTQLGFSKVLPQLALGQSQISILETAYFENEILDLPNLFIPPLSSNTMNADALKQKQNSGNSDQKQGRPELDDDKKSDKTIANKEAQS